MEVELSIRSFQFEGKVVEEDESGQLLKRRELGAERHISSLQVLNKLKSEILYGMLLFPQGIKVVQ